MKHILLTLAILACCTSLFAQQKINFHINGATETYQLNEEDSLYFNTEKTIMYFFNDGDIIQNEVATIDSISFTADESNNIYIEYLETTVNVTNPMSADGVVVDTDGAYVTITSTSDVKNINYICSGVTTTGNLKIYSEEKFNLLLNGVDITNPAGPAINSQSEKKATVQMLSGTSNFLADGGSYDATAANNGRDEDQKGAVFSEGKIDFIGSGTLYVQGLAEDKHAICSDKKITIDEGNIIISSAEKDGIHTDGFYMNGGTLTITSSGDGIDSEDNLIEINGGNILVNSSGDNAKAIKCDSTLTINGGSINLQIGGEESKGLKSEMDIYLNGGYLTGNAGGDAVLEEDELGYSLSYCSMILGEENILVDGTTINITTTGKGSRGITCEGNLTMESGSITIVSSGDGAVYINAEGTADAYHGTCLKVEGDLNIISGAMTCSNSGSGGKGISCEGSVIYGGESSQPETEVVTTGESITISGSGNNGVYDEAKAIIADQSIIINNGLLNVTSADDGLKAEVAVIINSGTVVVDDCIEGIEAPEITINDGNVEINSSNDGINSTYGNDGSTYDGSQMNINGGYVYVNSASGDALDSNGDITITGGVTVVHGPQSAPEVGLDVNGDAWVTGGFVIISGTNSDLTESFSSASAQNSLMIKSTQSISSNTLIHLEDTYGNAVFTFLPNRNYYSIVFSSSELTSGNSYNLYTGGTSTGNVADGLYTGGTYSGGTLQSTFTINSMVTNVSF